MCRSLRRQQRPPRQNMSATPKDSYGHRLDTLKQALKPYRDNKANCLRSITRTARVNLNKHWKSLENVFAAAGRCGAEERAQNAVNEKLEMANGENARPVVGGRCSNTTADDNA